MAVYKLSRTAEQKLETIYEYSLLSFGEEQADAYYLSLHAVFELLAEQPELGRQFHEYRRHEHQSHTVFYKPEPCGILIVYILHEREDVEDKIKQGRAQTGIQAFG